MASIIQQVLETKRKHERLLEQATKTELRLLNQAEQEALGPCPKCGMRGHIDVELVEERVQLDDRPEWTNANVPERHCDSCDARWIEPDAERVREEARERLRAATGSKNPGRG
jgi:hypothetical protein